VHKFRHVVGGVETHLHTLVAQQLAAGVDVEVFSSEDVPGDGFHSRPRNVREAIGGARTLMWSRSAAAAMEERLDDFQPHIVHFHSIYHHLSPSVLAPLGRRSIPAVMTLHDYKLVAPCYTLGRDGTMCTACVGRRAPLPAIRYRCVKGSIIASSLCAVEQVAHAPAYRAGIDLFLVPSAYARDVMAKSRAVRADRLRVSPLGVEVPPRSATPGDSHTIVFFGRVAPEKGIRQLLQAWVEAALPEPWRLQVVGDGALRTELERLHIPGVEFVGHVDSSVLPRLLLAAAVAVVPSVFPETFGLSAAEAMAHGLPVLAADVGNLPALVQEGGRIVPSGDVAAWARAMTDLADSPEERIRLGHAGRSRIANEFTLDHATRHVFAAYEAAIGEAVNEPLGGVRAVA
jgi:glycosyltransferase involved in cell wall biosynthesis